MVRFAVGTERSKGYKIVSISGHVQKPGNYEVPLGTPVRELIEIAGGLRPGRKLMAIQPGGGSSACIFEEHLDLPYDYESMAKAGSMLGSAAFCVMDDTTDFVNAAFNLVRFFAHESCGQCTPCREGGHWLETVLAPLRRRSRPAVGSRYAAQSQPRDHGLESVRARRFDRAVFGFSAQALPRSLRSARLKGNGFTGVSNGQQQLVNVTIDGVPLQVPKGTLLVEAAKQIKREIPVYCYHTKMGPAGLCRICLVEIEGMPKLQIGCNTTVTDGMVVRTQSDKAADGRRACWNCT